MDIYHWWLIKMVAIQLLCGIGVGWGVRYLQKNQTPRVKIQNVIPTPTQSMQRD